MTIQPWTGLLIGLAMFQTIIIMVGWHGVTQGAWSRFPAGRVLMGLLGIMWAILTLATASSFFPAFTGRPWVYLALYLILNVALTALGYTIIREQRKHNKD